jgi:hypothetical protein
MSFGQLSKLAMPPHLNSSSLLTSIGVSRGARIESCQAPRSVAAMKSVLRQRPSASEPGATPK